MSSSSSSTGSVAENLATIKQRVEEAAKNTASSSPPRLVAVSKTKPVEALQEAYDAGQRHFGENYVHEIVEKAPALPKDIYWHFIGHLQSKKAKPMITAVPNLWMVESVDSIKLADKLQQATVPILDKERQGEPLKVLIQIDTSGEETKSGVTTEEALEIVQHILAECPALKFAGVMTIGAPGDMTCFDRLVEARKTLATATGLEEDGLELSMGMSGDFEEAIARGSTNVRVGSSIFGERSYPAKKPTTPPPVAAATEEVKS
jgi:pyridoxal phosphate enzyme (YggS family)